MFTQRLERYDFEGAFVRRGQYNEGRGAVVVSAKPVPRGNTPPVAGHQSGETVLRNGRAEVITNGPLVLEKFCGHYGTNGVTAQVFGTGRTAPVTVEARHGIGATGL
jgi:hypothetical protein